MGLTATNADGPERGSVGPTAAAAGMVALTGEETILWRRPYGGGGHMDSIFEPFGEGLSPDGSHCKYGWGLIGPDRDQ